jgi:hypothetical protein
MPSDVGIPGGEAASPLPSAVPAAAAPSADSGTAELAPAEAASPARPETAGQPALRPAHRRRAGRVIALVMLLAAGIAGFGGGGAALARELTRGPTSAEQAAAVQQEIASRWQRLPAGKVFTSTLGYVTGSGYGLAATARRVGIASPASCTAALDPVVAGLLRKYGCLTVLRASYVDYSGTLAVTVGIAVMTSANAASQAASHGQSLPAAAGVRTFPLPGTVLDQFGDAQRGYFSQLESIGPYVLLAADGYTDGRPGNGESTLGPLDDLIIGVLASLQGVISAHPSACAMRDIRC